MNIESAYDHFEEIAKDKRQAGPDGRNLQRQLVFIHPDAYKQRNPNNQEYQQEDNEYSRHLFNPQQAQEVNFLFNILSIIQDV